LVIAQYSLFAECVSFFFEVQNKPAIMHHGKIDRTGDDPFWSNFMPTRRMGTSLFCKCYGHDDLKFQTGFSFRVVSVVSVPSSWSTQYQYLLRATQ